MSKLSLKHKKAERHLFVAELKEVRGYDKFCKETERKILNHLFGDNDGWVNSKFKVVYTRNPYIKSKWWQRLNRLWVYPVFICIMPFQWVVSGETGVDKDSKLGGVLVKLLGNNW